MYNNHQIYESPHVYSQHVGSYQIYRPPPPPVQYSYQQVVDINPYYQHQVSYPQPVAKSQPPPPFIPSQYVYTPTIPVTSWHPLEAKIQYRPEEKYQQWRKSMSPERESVSPEKYSQDGQIKSKSKLKSKSKSKSKSKKKSSSKLSKSKLSSITSLGTRSSIKFDELGEGTPKFEHKNDIGKVSSSGSKIFDKKQKTTYGSKILEGNKGDEGIQEVESEEDDNFEDGDDNEDRQSDGDGDEDESQEESEDNESDYEDDDDVEKFARNQMKQRYSLHPDKLERSPRKKKIDDPFYENTTALRNNKITDENRFETLYRFKKINEQHNNLFESDFKEDYKMDDVFKYNKIKIDKFNLKKNDQTAPSYVWKTRALISPDNSIDDQNQQNEEVDKYTLWDVRYFKIGEADYLISQSNNIFSRKSNYLRLGLFYKQASIRYQFDRTKEIVYYMYNYNEYQVRKKKSELEEEQNLEDQHINSLSYLESEEEDLDFENEYQPNVNTLEFFGGQNQVSTINVNPQASKANLKDSKIGKSTIAKSKVLSNTSNLYMTKSRFGTNTTINRSDCKSKVKETYNFAQSNFLRDYENIHGGEDQVDPGDDNDLTESKVNKSQFSQEKSGMNLSDNYSKLYKSRSGGQRLQDQQSRKKREDDLSKIKQKHNKYKLWEKNAVSEDAFLDQVRDSTIESVKRARHLEHIIVEKTSIFEHHAASLLNEHLSQLRKLDRNYKKELYRKVKEVIQFIYDEYKKVIAFESRNTFVMLVCDKKEKDKILGIHYHGYQGKKYFEKYLDEFVTYSRTREDFEEKRYQAIELSKVEENLCKHYFLK